MVDILNFLHDEQIRLDRPVSPLKFHSQLSRSRWRN